MNLMPIPMQVGSKESIAYLKIFNSDNGKTELFASDGERGNTKDLQVIRSNQFSRYWI